MYALCYVETLNKYWKFKYNKIISVMACRGIFFQEVTKKLIMSDKFILRAIREDERSLEKCRR